jgi:hypothetical protein
MVLMLAQQLLVIPSEVEEARGEIFRYFRGILRLRSG